MSGLYIHFPFCNSKCIYCGFYSVASLSLKNDFLQALQKEIFLKSTIPINQPVQTIYFGGGTPSLFSKDELLSVFHTISTHFDLHALHEFTIEANPEQCSLEYLLGLKELGINRISIGIQSLDNKILAYLGRKHSKEQALKAIENAYLAGFNNISIDLIYGIPLRTSEVWQQELELAFKQPITHLSAYSLTVEENSLLLKALQKKDPMSYQIGKDQDDEKAYNDLNQLLKFCDQQSFEQYEVSNYSKKGFESIHNSNYWNFTTYIGFGPSAHSYYDQSRFWNDSSLKKYIAAVDAGILYSGMEQLSLYDQFNETIMLGLRTKNGVNLEEIEKKYGEVLKQHLLHILKTLPCDLYFIQNNRFVLTRKGLSIADYIIEKLIWSED